MQIFTTAYLEILSLLTSMGSAHLKILSPLAWMSRPDLKLRRRGRDGPSPAVRLVANEGHDYDLEFVMSWPHES
jgi:hypothetical protein